MKIFIGADHNGYELKEKISAYLRDRGYKVLDKGNTHMDPTDDFPQYGAQVASEVLANENSIGILICGSGQGVCIAANRFNGIRAALAWDAAEARAARNDDDANILCLPARELGDFSQAQSIIDTFLDTPFAGAERYKRRIKQLDTLQQQSS